MVALVVAGLGAGAAAPAGAADAAPPTTVPTITVPAGPGNVAGDVALTATSTNPSTAATVQFFVDGNPVGNPVPVGVDGATTSWPSWGFANDSHHDVTAADCNSLGCNTTASAAVTVTVENAAPALTAPTEGATTDQTLTLTATAPGGGIAFFVDDAFVGFDATTPYSFAITSPLAEGPHTAKVVECDATGLTCNGPPSPTVHFTVGVLHPTITAVVPATISPNHDNKSDTTAFRIHLPDTENVSFHVENGNGQTVNGPHTAGALGAGDHVYHWDGRTNAAKAAGDGLYAIVVVTSASHGGVTLHGRAIAPVRVDDTAPSLSGITGNGAAFYPVADGYLDTFRPAVHVNEGGGLWLEIFTAKGALVKTIAQPHAAAGYFTIPWNGRDAHNHTAPEGAYRYKYVAEDGAHNRRTSAAYVVHLSYKRLVNHAVTFTHNGDSGLPFTTDSTCAQYSYGLSGFPHGIWLSNVCDPMGGSNFQVVAADYLFKVPAAVRYNGIRVESYGNTLSAPEPVLSIIYNAATKQYDPVGVGDMETNKTNVHTTYGTVHGSAYVDSNHFVDVSLGVPNVVDPEDYDIGTVTIAISYTVLQ